MSELSTVATAGAASGASIPWSRGCAAATLRPPPAQTGAAVRAAPARPHLARVGGDGESAFTIRVVGEKGLAALAAFDELAVARPT